ncbi:MAG: M48 family metalloprotease [Bacteroidota bacterium]
MRTLLTTIALGLVLVVYTGCGGNEDDNSINLFSIQDDINLGQQLRDEVLANPGEYGPVLPENQYPDAYGHLRRIRDEILNSGEVFYRQDFAWETYIIQDDSTLNAFAAPGGYIFVYTGLIKFLDNEDDFAGVLAHEIAHADRRHSTDMLTEAYGLQVALEVALGNASQSTISQLGQGLLSLGFSRRRETEADEFSVNYLCQTEYAANGAAGFFQKLLDLGAAGGTPEFLSTHPSPDNRVEAINTQTNDQNCDTDPNPNAMWESFQNSLP